MWGLEVLRPWRSCVNAAFQVGFITAEKGEVATAKGDGEKKKECTTECKSRRRRDEKAPWALNYEIYLIIIIFSMNGKGVTILYSIKLPVDSLGV